MLWNWVYLPVEEVQIQVLDARLEQLRSLMHRTDSKLIDRASIWELSSFNSHVGITLLL
jgi:hypothetical protein